jgi:hypothetical protein
MCMCATNPGRSVESLTKSPFLFQIHIIVEPNNVGGFSIRYPHHLNLAVGAALLDGIPLSKSYFKLT